MRQITKEMNWPSVLPQAVGQKYRQPLLRAWLYVGVSTPLIEVDYRSPQNKGNEQGAIP